MDNRLARALAGRLGGRTALADGGYGWLLQERGLAAGRRPEEWNLERPEVVARLHEEYAVTGATLLTTNTFGLPQLRLAASSPREAAHVDELTRAGARLARTVADHHDGLVLGSMGPSGALMAPLGPLHPEQVAAVYAHQARCLLSGGADILVVETMSDLAEATAAVAAVRRAAPEAPLVATMSFESHLHTMMGVTPQEAAPALAAAGADAVGANCGRGPADMDVVAREFVRHRPDGVLVVAQPNAGLPHAIVRQEDGRPVHETLYEVGPDELTRHLLALRAAGVDIIGTCCGSCPAHTSAASRALHPGTSVPRDCRGDLADPTRCCERARDPAHGCWAWS